jgi:hypothetical protein
VFPKEILEWKADWEHKEEIQTKESLLNDWAAKREVTPPKRLVDLINNHKEQDTKRMEGINEQTILCNSR